MLERSTKATLVQCLIERWWDTTHTVHIAEQEMIVTPYDLYRMTSLSFEAVIINLDDVSSIQLGLDMLGRKNSSKGLWRSTSRCLGLFFYICWELISSLMVGK